MGSFNCLHRWLSIVLFLVAVAHGQELDLDGPGKCVGPNFVPTKLKRKAFPFSRPPEGFGNNPFKPLFGNRGRVLVRGVRSAYADGISLPSGGCTRAQRLARSCPNPGEHVLENGTALGSVRPLARSVSNIVIRQRGVIGSERGISDIAVHWGQTLAHDTELTPPRLPLEALRIQIPRNDRVFDTNQPMDFFRSIFQRRCTGEGHNNPREQLNLISAFIDGTFLYGATLERAEALRGKNGMMKLAAGRLPPRVGQRDVEADNPRGEPKEELFFCGDVRCNEAIGLLSIITLFLREHNRRAGEYLARIPHASSNAVYEWSRKMTIATIQSITFNEYLPALFGRTLPAYRGFNPRVRPEIENIFSSAARRFGHSQINPTIELIRSNGRVLRRIPLDSTLYRVNDFVSPRRGLDPFFRGFLAKRAQQMDPHVDNVVRNRLFEARPGGSQRDLAATNIQRGRDHGLPDFGTIRQRCKLRPKYRSTDDISSSAVIRKLLRGAYGGNINLVDLFVGGLAEDRQLGSEFGQTFTVILLRTFFRLRTGDRFWYERILSRKELKDVKASTLAEVIRRNTGLKNVPRANLFFDRRFCATVISNQCIPRRTPRLRTVIRQLRVLARRSSSRFLARLLHLGILSKSKRRRPRPRPKPSNPWRRRRGRKPSNPWRRRRGRKPSNPWRPRRGRTSKPRRPRRGLRLFNAKRPPPG